MSDNLSLERLRHKDAAIEAKLCSLWGKRECKTRLRREERRKKKRGEGLKPMALGLSREAGWRPGMWQLTGLLPAHISTLWCSFDSASRPPVNSSSSLITKFWRNHGRSLKCHRVNWKGRHRDCWDTAKAVSYGGRLRPVCLHFRVENKKMMMHIKNLWGRAGEQP